MSGNRANSSAVQRRTSSAPSNVAPPGSSRPMQGQQTVRPVVGNGRPMQQQQQQIVQQPVQNPKMSVSDAIGLLSLRLGRVETFIQQMPPLDQIGLNSTGEPGAIGENMRVVDEAVFTSIVSRLERLEHTPRVSTPATVSTPSPSVTPVHNEELKHSVEVLKAEMSQVKELLLSLQSFTMQTNQKLVDIVFTENNQNDEDYDVNNLQISHIEVADDNEVLAESIDLKSFVQSNI
jgi:hypothetical protein